MWNRGVRYEMSAREKTVRKVESGGEAERLNDQFKKRKEVYFFKKTYHLSLIGFGFILEIVFLVVIEHVNVAIG